MTYTNALDAVDPTQSEKARLGAGRIRVLASALRERLASISIDPDADPLVLKPSTVGASQIVDGSVGTLELADLGVTTAKIANLAVNATKIADAAVDIIKLTADARSKLTDRIVVATFGFSALTSPLPANDKLVFYLTYGSAIEGKALIAYWKASPAVDIPTDTVQLGCTLTPVTKGSDVGVVIRNHTAGILSLTGYSVEVCILVDP